mmetsp:Transcript_27497/g.20658  ORF Transcript_27497/g.20658 Transcript_27497/m.20658 type:complete len:162 (-) Transcript_27497:309-794(-)|eukprot:CAMPEP_0202957026 /NCGR_PEP_ID=MMETSP1396-20130829/1450_1 /ASSEMBLY_ACC=CAM_ASM_000872 /TAXON_ID= /ORGANISM="Pseudokeronopsis sp., Strain Brazil" /LENGTH=161 /DNA_ID=CAMNT_0049674289 /DNA_START=789 /DNA_END=1274 /DNA_ORIENTATION=+
MGAKNHAIVMPDADKEDTLNALIGACYGSSGQRCMAISTVILVGDAAKWIPDIVEKSKKLTVGPGIQNVDIAPVITKESKQRIEAIIERATKENKVLLDGRGVKVPGYEKGNFVGPTIIDDAVPGTHAYDEEIFGPVMCILKVNTLQEGIDLINKSKYGNG